MAARIAGEAHGFTGSAQNVRIRENRDTGLQMGDSVANT